MCCLSVPNPFLTILPSFITNETRSVAVMSAVGSPGMAMISANLPFSSVPTFCAIPQKVGVNYCGRFQRVDRRHPEIDHQLEFFRVLAVRENRRVRAE